MRVAALIATTSGLSSSLFFLFIIFFGSHTSFPAELINMFVNLISYFFFYTGAINNIGSPDYWSQ